MTIQNFIYKLKDTPLTIVFSETMRVIEANYNFTPTAFKNGNLQNNAGENNGSCQLFAFAIHQNLTKEETLYCFGEHYSTVLEDEHGTNHQNIRNFMKTGFEGLSFEANALILKDFLKPTILEAEP